MVNDRGEEICTEDILQIVRKEYLIKDEQGKLQIDWGNGLKDLNGICYADDLGFDQRAVRIDDRKYKVGENVRQDGYKFYVSLRKNDILIRYGQETGHFTAPLGTKYEKLSLPYVHDKKEYHEYIVVADLIEFEILPYSIFGEYEKKDFPNGVWEGLVAPGFGQEGGGIQFFHSQSIYRLKRDGILMDNPNPTYIID